MSEKVEITKEQAEAIETLKREQVKHFKRLKKYPYKYTQECEKALMKLSEDTFEKALYEGYSIKRIVDTGDWVTPTDERLKRKTTSLQKRPYKVVSIVDRGYNKLFNLDNICWVDPSVVEFATDKAIEEEKKRRTQEKVNNILTDLTEDELSLLHTRINETR